MQVITNLQGVEGLKRKLALLPERLGRNAARRALRKGANIIRDAARANARRFDDPETREAIYKNIVVANGGMKRERRVGGAMVRVGVIGGAQSGKKLVHADNKTNRKKGIVGQEYSLYHWRYLEFGTSQMRAQPFMRPAMNSQAGAAAQAAMAAMEHEFDVEAAKIAAMP